MCNRESGTNSAIPASYFSIPPYSLAWSPYVFVHGWYCVLKCNMYFVTLQLCYLHVCPFPSASQCCSLEIQWGSIELFPTHLGREGILQEVFFTTREGSRIANHFGYIIVAQGEYSYMCSSNVVYFFSLFISGSIRSVLLHCKKITNRNHKSHSASISVVTVNNVIKGSPSSLFVSLLNYTACSSGRELGLLVSEGVMCTSESWRLR